MRARNAATDRNHPMTDYSDTLKSLHTTLIDSRNGYDEALQDAEGKGLTSLFREMIASRDRDIQKISVMLRTLGQQADCSGSFMSTVHRTVISVRSMITGLDASILPSLISGEERIIKTYDDAIAAAPADVSDTIELESQRNNLERVIDNMRRMKIAIER
jgi:uncharacterized protein (TIGR02284 family)